MAALSLTYSDSISVEKRTHHSYIPLLYYKFAREIAAFPRLERMLDMSNRLTLKLFYCHLASGISKLLGSWQSIGGIL